MLKVEECLSVKAAHVMTSDRSPANTADSASSPQRQQQIKQETGLSPASCIDDVTRMSIEITEAVETLSDDEIVVSIK